MATTQHYLWASGHFLLLVSTLRYLTAWIMFKGISTWWYKASYTGALISYFIVCQKSLGTFSPNTTYLGRALLDENFQYFLLAAFWWTSKPIAITLLPFAIFSLFHTLTFVRATLMPQFLPPGAPATAGGPPQPHPIAKKLQVWVKSNYDTAMRAVAYVELIILLRVLLGAIFLQNSLLSPIIYAHFLRARYYQSEFTRNTVNSATAYVDQFVSRPGNPPMLLQIWDKVKMLTSRWAGAVIQQPAPAQPAPRR